MFYCKFLDFHDQWIKVLISWSSLCNDCLESMTYIYIYTLSLNAIIFFSLQIFKIFLKNLSSQYPPVESPAGPYNIRPGESRGI
jgi:hypothetical protein